MNKLFWKTRAGRGAAPALMLGVMVISSVIGARGAAEEAPGRLTLVEGGRPRAAIVIPARKGRPAEMARILAAHLEQISGAKVPTFVLGALGKVKIESGQVVPEAGKIDAQIVNFILIGESDLTRGLGLSTEGMGAGGLIIKTTGNVLALCGMADGQKSPGGDSYAVYRFLERLGCRWLWPGESGKVIPKMETIAVGPLDIRDAPRLAERKIRFASTEREDNTPKGLERLKLSLKEYREVRDAAAVTPASGEWADWQGLGGNLGYTGGHNGAWGTTAGINTARRIRSGSRCRPTAAATSPR